MTRSKQEPKSQTANLKQESFVFPFGTCLPAGRFAVLLFGPCLLFGACHLELA
jgi:hypothetical protein